MTQIFEENGFSVQRDDRTGAHTVFRPSGSGTHSESDSSYGLGVDGAGMAIARAMYLARGAGRWAGEATELALQTATSGDQVRYVREAG